MTAIPLQRAKSALKGDSVRKHAALTGINGSLAEINVESPACGARSKTTIRLYRPVVRINNARFPGGEERPLIVGIGIRNGPILRG